MTVETAEALAGGGVVAVCAERGTHRGRHLLIHETGHFAMLLDRGPLLGRATRIEHRQMGSWHGV